MAKYKIKLILSALKIKGIKTVKILLNSVFVGGYGFDEGNLPHEVINFFRADDRHFYIYITPYGTIDSKMEIKDLKAVLFIQAVGNGMVEVVAKAEIDNNSNDDDFYTKGIALHGKNEFPEQYHTIIDKKKKEEYETKVTDANIKYGDVTIQDIHKDNKVDNEIHVTMKAKSICFPRKPIYLTNNEKTKEQNSDIIFISHKKMANQSMKTYYDEQNTAEKSDYAILNEIVETEAYWLSPDQTPDFDAFNKSDMDDTTNFFQIARQQNNEIIFSNMFCYFFSQYPDLRQKFASEVLGIELDSNCSVEREKDNIDIRLIDDKHYIIIENKIKSLVNGISQEKGMDGKSISQLSKYYEQADKQKGNRSVHAFLFKPNYNPIRLDDLLCGDKYTIVTYNQIYTFFTEYRDKTGNDDFYLNEFIKAMKKHTKKTDQEFREKLMQKFVKRISEQRGTVK